MDLKNLGPHEVLPETTRLAVTLIKQRNSAQKKLDAIQAACHHTWKQQCERPDLNGQAVTYLNDGRNVVAFRCTTCFLDKLVDLQQSQIPCPVCESSQFAKTHRGIMNAFGTPFTLSCSDCGYSYATPYGNQNAP